MGVSRSLTGDDRRGSSYDRRARRAWLLSPAAGFGGDGVKVACWEPHCGAFVTAETMCVDRIIPGEYGGSYRRGNIRPQCAPCSHRSGARRTWEIKRATDPYDDTDHCKTCGAHYLGRHDEGCPTPVLDGVLTGT